MSVHEPVARTEPPTRAVLDQAKLARAEMRQLDIYFDTLRRKAVENANTVRRQWLCEEIRAAKERLTDWKTVMFNQIANAEEEGSESKLRKLVGAIQRKGIQTKAEVEAVIQ